MTQEERIQQVAEALYNASPSSPLRNGSESPTFSRLSPQYRKVFLESARQMLEAIDAKPSPETRPTMLKKDVLMGCLSNFVGYTYAKKGSNPSYPWPMPGVTGLQIAPPAKKQNNCCTFVEGLVIGTALHCIPAFSWGQARHEQMMIEDASDLFSPVTALVASGLATECTTPIPVPWTVIQCWNQSFSMGHTFFVADYDAPTDKVLILESNSVASNGFYGVGWRGYGPLLGGEIPEDWTLYPTPTWASCVKKRPQWKGATLIF